MKRRIALGFSVAVLLLALLVHAVGSHDIAAELGKADPRVLAVGFLSGGLALTFRGLAWTRFIELVDETMPRRRIGEIFLTSMFVKYVTRTARHGAVRRLRAASKRSSRPSSPRSGASIRPPR